MKKNKRLGILAGMGPRSTAPFLDLVYDQCQKQYGAKYDIDYPEIFLLSWPTPFYIDKPIDYDLLKNSILVGITELNKCKTDIIAIPCNIAHLFFDEYRKATDAEILNIIDVTMNKIPYNARKITVLAAESTMKSGIYQKGIINKNREYYFNGTWQSEVNEIIKNIKTKTNFDIIFNRYKILEKKIKNENIDTVIFACTDLSILTKVKNDIDIIDSSEALAEKAIEKYLE